MMFDGIVGQMVLSSWLLQVRCLHMLAEYVYEKLKLYNKTHNVWLMH